MTGKIAPLSQLQLPPSVYPLEAQDFTAAMAQARNVVRSGDDTVFRATASCGSPPLISAMRYAVEGGKALRAFLVLESGRLNGRTDRQTGLAALAIEYLHAYSLIHDDLPCMDDDDMRRGKPTVHKKWNEYTAVLAGDALQSLAFELLAHPSIGDERTCLRLIRSLASAAGHRGMVGGQMMDIAAETRETPYSLDQIMKVQKGKTGALIKWATTAGAIIADANDERYNALERYGSALGLAFQIADDVLDVEGSAEEMGKATQKDTGRGKTTFVSHLGLDGAKRRAAELVHEACTALDHYGDDAECLREAARFVISRRH